MSNIWQQLPQPIWCLAPMFGATDSAFRQLLAEIGKPDLMLTEFTNVQAIFSPDNNAVQQLTYSAKEQPLIAQIWGLDPELFEVAADVLVEAGFVGIDINMGCPQKAVVKKGGGAGLVANRRLAGEIIRATRRGAAGKVPLSVKTRLGLNRIDFSWIEFLLRQNPDALIIHGRTAREMSAGPVHWQELAQAVALRNQLKLKTKIIINGDLFTREEALRKIRLTGADGAMLGRAVFRDLYLFSAGETMAAKTKQQKLALLNRHLDIYTVTWGTSRSYQPLKRFFKIYASGFPGALALRVKLMATRSVSGAKAIIGQ